MKKIDEFTNLYSLQKTLRFKLIPIGETAANFTANRLLEEDERRAQSYAKVKGYLDRYYKAYIDTILPHIRLDWVREYAELYYTPNKSEKQRKEAADIEAKLRKQIADSLTKDERYKHLFGKDVLDSLRSFLTSKEELDCVAEFDGFSTYFQGFFQNRENIFSAEAKATAISNRCVSDNLPRFLDNAKNYIKIKNAIPDEIAELDTEFDGLFGTKIDDVFSVDYFTLTLSQDGIDVYNQIIGGYTTSDGNKVQGINEIINRYNQPAPKESKLPKLKALYKQILSERKTVSFIPESFECDQEVLDAIGNYFGADESGVTISEALDDISKLASALPNSDIGGVFVKNGPAVTTMSKKTFGSWDAVLRGWGAEYDSANGYKDTEAYIDKRKKAYDSVESFSIL